MTDQFVLNWEKLREDFPHCEQPLRALAGETGLVGRFLMDEFIRRKLGKATISRIYDLRIIEMKLMQE